MTKLSRMEMSYAEAPRARPCCGRKGGCSTVSPAGASRVPGDTQLKVHIAGHSQESVPRRNDIL